MQNNKKVAITSTNSLGDNMAQQNIFDNDVFFEGYKALRSNTVNANNLFEIPALFSMLPNLKGKRVLDLGCGFGEHCKLFVDGGAESVVGVDISSKMLEIAQKENSHPQIKYIHMPMEDIKELHDTFDIVVSSLALHYIEEFSDIAKSIYHLLDTNGVFVFSQEHPLVTCHSGGDRWTRDANGEKIHVNIANYGVSGERKTRWFVDNIKIYHRTFSEIVNTLSKAGFTIEQMIEPLPTDELLKKHPEYRDLLHKPDFLLLKVRKANS